MQIVTADPPRRLRRGQHFDLARGTAAALDDAIAPQHRMALLHRFGFESREYDDGTWLDDLLRGGEPDLIELAEYLKVPIPVDSATDDLPTATELNAYSELVAAETAFRDIVRSAIGSAWTNDFTQEKLTALEDKRAEEDKKRDGVIVSQDLLDYTEAYHLESLILKHWDKTGPILKDKKRTEVYLNLMLDVRNTVAHARPVVPFERHLLAGVAGQIQNLISRHRNDAETADSYYASINYVRDSFGDEVTSSSPSQTANHRLKAGQTVTFECSATDPYDREVEWSFSLSGQSSADERFDLGIALGAQVNFLWTVKPDHFGEGRYVSVSMSNESRYRRKGSWDDAVHFRYNISPPLPPLST